MPPRPQLWKARTETTPALAQQIADAFEDSAVSVTIMAPPRKAMAQVEALYSEEPPRAVLEMQVAILAKMHKLNPPKLIIEPVGDLDWLKKVAEDFPPLSIARWTIFGAAHRDKISMRQRALEIDATSAFGTGEHPTTRGCLLMLHSLLKKHKVRRMFDVGCGSGILAMAFVQATKGRAVAVDMDTPSVEIAKNNARRNGMAHHIRAQVGMGYRSPLVKKQAPYDLIMANIFARPLCELAVEMKRHLRPGGIAILSGILNHQANGVISAHRQQQIYLIGRMKIGEWSILALQRPIRNDAAHD